LLTVNHIPTLTVVLVLALLYKQVNIWQL
jgi:hypothetical protein